MIKSTTWICEVRVVSLLTSIVDFCIVNLFVDFVLTVKMGVCVT